MTGTCDKKGRPNEPGIEDVPYYIWEKETSQSGDGAGYKGGKASEKDTRHIFVVGNIGSRRLEAGKRIAENLSVPLAVLDDLIEEKDGRSIRRITMTMGEHEYRNKEFEVLTELCEGARESEDTNVEKNGEGFKTSGDSDVSEALNHMGNSGVSETLDHMGSSDVSETLNHMGDSDKSEVSDHVTEGSESGKSSWEKPMVIVCGDGTLLDDMNRELIEEHKIVVADPDTEPNELWENMDARAISHYAFAMDPDEEKRFAKFCEMHKIRKPVFEKYTGR